MSAIMKNITYNHILLCLILLAMTGCASKTNIEANLDDGKSIVILPSYGTGISTMYWAKVGSNNTYNFSFHYGTSRLGTLSKSGKYGLYYFALPIEAGTYYIKSISVKSIGGFNPAYTEEYNSTLGDIVLEKNT
ncbi:MAG: hypothetical protein LBG21_00530 [Campylobacteraceae bacterium]|jgi:hypothetical protein|nr:hypothetical protein [Campylobacteraceae bacterium]